MKFPEIKKSIGLFLTSEEAKVLKQNVVKIGLTASAIAAVMSQLQDARAAHDNTAHTDSHSDAEGHSDSHSDTPTHTDSHVDGAPHSSCTHDDFNTHTSDPIYDDNSQSGGHNSFETHTDDAC